MSKEIWKDIKDYEGSYQVSSLGRVKSLPKSGPGGHADSIILKQNIDKDGYHWTSLRKDGKATIWRVHRLVARAFLPDFSDSLEINHKNEIPGDNRVENLEMCTRQYNIDYGTRTEKYYKPIIQETLDGKFIAEYASVDEAAKAIGGKSSNIVRYLKGGYPHSKTHKIYTPTSSYGYKWRYKE